MPEVNVPTLMLVEDDPEDLYLIRRYIKSSGCRMINTGLGEEAVALACQEKPDLILLDIRLPGINGWEVLEALKAESATQTIPVLMFSGLDEVEDGQARGAFGYLKKPVRYRDFLNALAEVGVKPGLAVA
jgi:CheY-like chemotaxis protein